MGGRVFDPGLEFVVDGLPPSDNNAYVNVRGAGRVLKKVGRDWKTAVQAAYLEQVSVRTRQGWRRRPAAYCVSLGFEMSLFAAKDGQILRWDVSSHQKLTVDALAEVLGVADEYVSALLVLKTDIEPGAKPRTRVTVGVGSFGPRVDTIR